MINFPIYLDNHSTTKPDPRAVEAMLPYLTEIYGNASTKANEFGWKAEAGVELARKQVAGIINAQSKEIIFTSGATESINLAIKGAAESYSAKGNHIITAQTEHKAVLDTCKHLEKSGFLVTYLKVDKNGLIDPNELSNSITDNTILVSIMFANNEIGTIQPIEEIGKICSERGVLFHTDATQAIGKIPVDVIKCNIDMLSMTAHKLHGPKGVGALYIKNRSPKIKLNPQSFGGGQEKALRAGTMNVPGIVGLGKACEIAGSEIEGESKSVKHLRDMLQTGIMSTVNESYMNGHPIHRLPNNLNISFRGVDADSLMMSMNDIAVSTGSACSSDSPETSHVLNAINVNEDLKRCTIRFGLSRFTTEEEIDHVIKKITEKVHHLREISPAYQMKKGAYEEA
jgi:cysteine desulfurase